MDKLKQIGIIFLIQKQIYKKMYSYYQLKT